MYQLGGFLMWLAVLGSGYFGYVAANIIWPVALSVLALAGYVAYRSSHHIRWTPQLFLGLLVTYLAVCMVVYGLGYLVRSLL